MNIFFLAFLLADEGYDVWLGNARGNRYSRCHLHYSTSEYSFWNFSYHEIGVYDLPAHINYIKKIKDDDLFFVGHSMGTTVFYVMAIERPNVASKVKAMFSFAPIAFLSHIKSPVRFLAPFYPISELIFRYTTSGEIIGQTVLWKLFVKYGCSVFLVQKDICLFFLFSVVGFDYHQYNTTRLPMILNHYPDEGSSKTLDHYAQGMVTGRFQKYDYGKQKNQIFYNSSKPPDYDLSKIQVPIGVFWSGNDYFADQEDVKLFYNSLPKKLLNYKVKYPFNHIDFAMAIDARYLLYSKLLSVIKNYNDDCCL